MSGAGRIGRRTAALSLALILCVLPSASRAAGIYPSEGSTSAAFLKLPVGARAAAMAGAFTAVPGDPFAVYWNPAGLAYAPRVRSLGFFHNDYFQGLGQEFLSYTERRWGGALGLGLNYFYSASDMERRSGLYESDPANPVSPVEGTFGAYDLAFSAAYGWNYRPDLALGGAVKLIRQSIDTESGASVALDLGLLRSFAWRGAVYTAGASVQNIGPGIKFVSRRYGLPLIFRTGLSRRFDEYGLLVSLEADKAVDNYPSFVLGTEYKLTDRLSVRSGYSYRLHGNELGGWSGFSAGAGVAFDRLTFDYAFSPFGVLGNSHRFSINLRFGGGAPSVAVPSASVPAAPPPPPPGFANCLFSSSQRPLGISRLGIKYEITAVSSGCAVSSLSFRTLLMGLPPAEFSLPEGTPAGELKDGFPEGVKPLKIWRPDGLAGNVQGDVVFVFRLPPGAGPGAPVFMFRDGKVWKEAAVSGPSADGSFSASAPYSGYYALGLRTGG